MLLAVMFLTILVAIPNALAGRALFEGITFLTATPNTAGSGVPLFFGFDLPFRGRFAERHGAELLCSRRCTVLFR